MAVTLGYHWPNTRGASTMGPLERIRVVEVSTGIAGPVAGMLLGDYGGSTLTTSAP